MTLPGLFCVLCLFPACAPQSEVDPNRASISGHVTLADQPVTGGSISIVSEKDPNYRITGMIKADGQFSFDGAPVGGARVSVETESIRFGDPTHYVPIPRKYSRIESSGIRIDVRPGDNPDVAVALP